MEIQKGMYGLPQAGKIENDKLKLHLAKFGYEPAPITPGIWHPQFWTNTISTIEKKLQMINLSYIWPSLDTSQHQSPQVYGGTKLTPFNFHW